ncbi:hypothetical protein BRADI_1g70271v3 [Brachypodium distachyon]|uniref:Uncharacterized protein n=1 Tax=Brachypodium distachyon TaxID=15368 RepID=A0A0Q3JZK8_BRADI|nr:hypothetical protein BRADI_1g70271v3 [Brachypodium distachyon]
MVGSKERAPEESRCRFRRTGGRGRGGGAGACTGIGGGDRGTADRSHALQVTTESHSLEDLLELHPVRLERNKLFCLTISSLFRFLIIFTFTRSNYLPAYCICKFYVLPF